MGIRENVGKPICDMVEFFQQMVSDGDLLAYTVERNRQEVLKDTDVEKITRTIKGSILIPTQEIRECHSYVVEDTETHVRYLLGTNYIYLLSTDHPHDRDRSYIKRLPGDLKSKTIEDGLEVVLCDLRRSSTAELSIIYDEASLEGTLNQEGETDSFLDRVMDFVRGS